MITAIASNHSSDSTIKKRGRKPRSACLQALAEAEKLLRDAQQARAKAVAKVEAEKDTELAKKGGLVYLRWVEKMRPAERDSHVTPLLASLPVCDHPAIYAWLDMLAK